MGKNDYTGLLYAQPSFTEGLARVLDLGGTFDDYNYSQSDEEADYLALASDWYAIGADLYHAITRFEANAGHLVPPDRAPPDPKEPKGDDAGPPVDPVGLPASKSTIVEDTSTGPIDLDKARAEDFRTTEASTAQGLLVGIQKRKIHAGPLPSPRTLREYQDIYPDAPKIIFEEFRAQ